MSKISWCALLLVAGTAFAQTAATTSTTAKKKTTARKTATATKAAPAAATAQDIQALRSMIEQQNQAMQEMRQQLQQRDAQLQRLQQTVERAQSDATEAQSKASSAEAAANEQKSTVSALQSDVSDVKSNFTQTAVQTQEDQKRVSAVEGVLNRFRWSGDIRVRNDDIFLAGQNPRVRARIRLRLGVEGDLGQDFVGGIAFASGVLSDPTSTNETLSNYFEKKVIGFDRGYVTYNPKAHKWLSLTGGKFAFTWIRTPQTFDSDLNPEGFSEKFSFDLKDKHVRNLTFTAMQLLFNENSRVAFGATGVDSYAVGGQLSSKLQMTKRWTLTPSYSLLNWHNEFVLATSAAFAGGAVPLTGSTTIVCNPTPATGACSFAVSPFAPNGFTNTYRISAVAANGNITRQFLGQFLYSDLILDNTITTKNPKWPVRVLLEYLDNLRAPAPAAGRSPASHSYLAELSAGQTRNKGDLQVGYAFLRQEKDSAIASFVESDQKLPTNVLQHRFYVNYKLHPKVTLSYTLWAGRILDSNLFAPVLCGPPTCATAVTDNLQRNLLAPGVAPGQVDHYLKRMFFDLVYSF